MDHLFALAAQNTLAALVLSLSVYSLTRVWRNPPVAHLLWLLVLLKLVSPGIVPVDWPALGLGGSPPARDEITAEVSPVAGQKVEGNLRLANRPMDLASAQASVPGIQEPGFAAGMWQFWLRARWVLLWLWLGGAAGCALVAVLRIVRFERALCDMLPASERLQTRASEIAGKLGVRRVPLVRYAQSVETPLL